MADLLSYFRVTQTPHIQTERRERHSWREAPQSRPTCWQVLQLLLLIFLFGLALVFPEVSKPESSLVSLSVGIGCATFAVIGSLWIIFQRCE